MNKVHIISNIKQILKTNKGVVAIEIVKNTDKCYLIEKDKLSFLFTEKIYYGRSFNEGFVYQIESGCATYYYDFSYSDQILPCGYFVTIFNQNINKKLKVANEEDKYFLFDVSKGLEPLIDFPHYFFDGIFFRKKKMEIIAFTDSIKWIVDVKKTYSETDGDLMDYENLLFVPLRGGQLLALDAQSGQKMWIKDYNGRSGFYAIYKDKIYKHDGVSLIEIDARTGDSCRKIIYSKESDEKINTFYSLNNFWVYEDIIILSGNQDVILLLNRKDFTLYQYLQLPAPIATGNDNIVWHDRRLYVLDMTQTLHVFE